MPHITFPLADLRALSGRRDLTLAQVDELALMVKGELKARHSTEDAVKLELQDTNRPDTWCVEGVARQIRQKDTGRAGDYGFFDDGAAPAGAIEVDGSVEPVRPYVSGFLVRDYTVDEHGLEAFIEVQETLCDNFGRKRKAVAIGIYDAGSMALPVRYEAVALDSTARAFSPLRPPSELGDDGQPRPLLDGQGQSIPAKRWEQPWTPAQILADHPTGRKYAAALQGASLAPILVDANEQVLSFPPLINSARLGRVQPGMSALFVEVTGTNQDQVLLAANILAANLADRGATIAPMVTRYPYDTPRGREVRCPHPLSDRRSVEVPLGEFRRLLGEPELTADEVVEHLTRFGLGVERQGERLVVTTPAYRLDYLHAVDAIEDFAISRGYDQFAPRMPEEFTIGGLAPQTLVADWAREVLIGCGFQEAIGNLLTSEEELRAKMTLDAETGWGKLHGGPLVKIHNVMNLNYAVLRDWLLPTLLEVERRSSSALFPHRFFEAGEVCVWDEAENHSTRTEQRLAAVLCHDKAGFSELQAVLDELLTRAGFAFGEGYTLTAAEHPCFIPGRTAKVEIGAHELGVLGEVHPAVLETWGLYYPVVAFELRLDALRAALHG